MRESCLKRSDFEVALACTIVSLPIRVMLDQLQHFQENCVYNKASGNFLDSRASRQGRCTSARIETATSYPREYCESSRPAICRVVPSKSTKMKIVQICALLLLMAITQPMATIGFAPATSMQVNRHHSMTTQTLTFPKATTSPTRRERRIHQRYMSAATVADTGIEEQEESDNKATIANLAVSLVKGVVGAGVLSLPSGIAAFGDAPSAFIPAMGLITVIGGLSAYSYSLLGRTASHSSSSTFSETWDKSVGAKSA
jgi:hypothetical protein